MKLYGFSGSCALAAHICLAWTSKPYEFELIEKDDLAKPEFKKLNPYGKVPIYAEDDWVLYENAAILNYLADQHPEARLGGDGSARSRAEVNRWMALINSDIHPTFKPLFGATAYLGDEAAVEASKDNARQQLRGYFEKVDRQLEGRDWLTGQRSVADPYLLVTTRWAHLTGVDLDGLDNIARFEKHMNADAGVQKALKEQKLKPL